MHRTASRTASRFCVYQPLSAYRCVPLRHVVFNKYGNIEVSACRRHGAPYAACMPDRAGPVTGGVRGDARCVPRVVPDVGCRAAGDAAKDSGASQGAGDASRRPRASSITCARATHRRALKTLRAAARDGRLPVTYDTKTTFRRLRARATLAAAQQFRRSYFGRKVRPADRREPPSWASVPSTTTRRFARYVAHAG